MNDGFATEGFGFLRLEAAKVEAGERIGSVGVLSACSLGVSFAFQQRF
jgi:hypothetical protein